MTAPAAAPKSMGRGFAVGVAVLLLVFTGLGWALAASGREQARPEGVAEDWLAAQSDLTRKGVGDDARERLDELGARPVAENNLPEKIIEGKSAFTDLEVGKAGYFGGKAVVPFRVHEREGDDRTGSLLLEKRGGQWKVAALSRTDAGFVLPSEGGEQPSNAAIEWWAAALLMSVLLTLVFSGLVEWAGRGARVPSEPA